MALSEGREPTEEFEFLPTTVISEPVAPKTLLIAGAGIDRCRRFMEQGSVLSIPLNQLPPAPPATTKVTTSEGAGFAEVIERDETSGAAACNHPNRLVLPFSVELIRLAA